MCLVSFSVIGKKKAGWKEIRQGNRRGADGKDNHAGEVKAVWADPPGQGNDGGGKRAPLCPKRGKVCGVPERQGSHPGNLRGLQGLAGGGSEL